MIRSEQSECRGCGRPDLRAEVAFAAVEAADEERTEIEIVVLRCVECGTREEAVRPVA